MKKILTLIFAIVIIIIAFLYGFFNYNMKNNSIKKENAKYEEYLNKEIYGAELATIINKAIDSNENNNIERDNKGKYIENDLNSLKIDISFIDNNTVYDMETLYYGNINRFVENYNSIKFICKKIEYHDKTSKIKKLYFEQITQ